MGDAKGSVDAYQQGIDFEGNGGSDAMRKGLETAKKELARMEAEEDKIPEDEVAQSSKFSLASASYLHTPQTRWASATFNVSPDRKLQTLAGDCALWKHCTDFSNS